MITNLHDKERERDLFSRFLVPEDKVSPQTIFQNLQNYAICATILVVVVAVSPRVDAPNAAERLSPFLLLGMLTLATVLLLLTVLQSKALAEVVHANIKAHYAAKYGNRHFIIRFCVSTLLLAAFVVLYSTLVAAIAIGLAIAAQGVTAIESSG